ncbi:MAG: TrmJ/YjtD family RNA methyltransferase [Gammaproteobacteria bacterium]|nr:MAG: TrmJ/YjtD family RNA methyltransferase [Gammaproteobacteria bacterium]
MKIVLVEPSHPGNIGAAARAAKTMCIENLVLVNPEKFPSGEARARSTGAIDVLERAVVCDTLKEAIADCTFVVGASARERGLQCPEIKPDKVGARVWQELEQGNVAIVFGRESSGLTNEELDQCHYLTTIPANWEFSSLNLASAVQVISYEIYSAYLKKSSTNKTTYDGIESGKDVDPLATVEQLENLFEHMQQVLQEIEFFDPKQPKLLMRRLRHLYSRARPTLVETNILRGILSAVQKVRRQTKSLDK